MWAPLLVDVLMSHPTVRIVLSTSWARELRFDRARDYLPEALRRRVIGATWHSGMGRHSEGWLRNEGPTWWDQSTRYEQIHRYVQRAALTRWLAIDDQPEGWSEADRRHLIQTHSQTGLSDPAALDRLQAGLASMTAGVIERLGPFQGTSLDERQNKVLQQKNNNSIILLR